MSLRPTFLNLAGIALIGLVLGLWWSHYPELPPRAAHAEAFDSATVKRGATLALLGNCSDCHTVEGRPAFSGGRPLPTPYGTIFTSNLTPDPETGIGTWTEQAFHRAMRKGIGRSGQHLYPGAFPYDHFTILTNDDIRSLYAFLMTRPAVKNQPPANELRFPFSIRATIAGWKLLFFREGPYEPSPEQSADWNRGRYLVEGLGHCGSCHSERNVLGAERKSSFFGGGQIAGWTANEIAEYLSTGWQRQHGAAAGVMADVVRNLSRAPARDVHAIAVFVASLSASKSAARPANEVVSKEGRTVTGPAAQAAPLYEGACARCHNARGDVGPSQALALGLSNAVLSAEPADTVRAIVQGITSYRVDGGPYMPAFGGMLSDAQIAQLTEYVRARYSNKPAWTGVTAEVAKIRKAVTAP